MSDPIYDPKLAGESAMQTLGRILEAKHYRCSKEYRDIPIAHRQHMHEGHCRFIHGHSWHFKFVFGCHRRDEQTGFVVDFGNLKDLKAELMLMDHAMLLSDTDEELKAIFQHQSGKAKDTSFAYLFRPYPIKDSSCEGVAQHVFQFANELVNWKTGGRAYCLSAEVYEGDSNSAIFYNPVTALHQL